MRIKTINFRKRKEGTKTYAEKINDIYIQNRQQGYTSLMLQSIGRTPAPQKVCVIIHSQNYAQTLRRNLQEDYETEDIEFVCVHNLDRLRGVKNALMLIDNAVFMELAEEARKLREKNKELKEKIKENDGR